MTTQPYGEIFDRGYQHYDGERRGRGYAVWRLLLYSIKRGLGIKKRWTAKIIPIFLYAIAYLPAVIIVALLAFIPVEEFDGLGFDTLYDSLEFSILIFAAALAPEMLCDDRRERTLQLYFSRPITRSDYLFAKVGAMGFLMGTIIFGPPLLLFLGLTFSADSPISYLGDHIGDPLKILSYGLLASAFFAAVGLGAATFTTRKGVVGAVVIVGVLLSTAIANAFFEALDTQSWRGYLVLLSPFDFLQALRLWLFRSNDVNRMADASDVPGLVLLAWVVVIVAGAVALMYRTYLTEE